MDNIKKGDLVRLQDKKQSQEVKDIVYEVIDFDDHSVSLKHPRIGGYFIFSRELILEVVN